MRWASCSLWQLTSEVSSLRAHLEAQSVQAARLQDELTRQRQLRSSLQGQLRASERSCECLRAELSEAKRVVSELQHLTRRLQR